MSEDAYNHYDYDYSLYTPENTFFLSYNNRPTKVLDTLFINYAAYFYNTKKLISNISKTQHYSDPSLLPLAVRYVSEDQKVYVIERPPFQIDVDFSTAKSYRMRNTPKNLVNAKIWIPWTVSVILVDYQISSSFSNSYSFYLYFNDAPLSSMDDRLVSCYLPNSSNGNICMGQDSAPVVKMINNKSSITDIYNHLFNSYFGGWNTDLHSAIYDSEYFTPIINRIFSQNKKAPSSLRDFPNIRSTSSHFKNLLYVLSHTSLEEHLGYISYTKSNRFAKRHPSLSAIIQKDTDQFSGLSDFSAFSMATRSSDLISRTLFPHYDETAKIETNFKVSISDHDPLYVSQYISNPYIVATIYKRLCNFDYDPNNHISFTHSDLINYMDPVSLEKV